MNVPPPTKVSEVAAWLGANPNPDVSALLRGAKAKAAQRAAAVRALGAIGTPAALDALVTHRPSIGRFGAESEGSSGETFPDAVTKELDKAWARFDRQEFARRMFSGLLRLRFGTVAIASLGGMEVVPDLQHFQVRPGPKCSLTPLASCVSIEELDCWWAGAAPSGAGRVSELPALHRLSLGTLDQAGVDSLARATRLKRLKLWLHPGVDLGALSHLTSLERVWLHADAVAPSTAAVVRALVERGVDVGMYDQNDWPRALLGDLRDLTCIEQSGFVVFTRDPARVETLRGELRGFCFI